MLPEFDLAQAIGMLSFALGILCFYQRDDQHLRIMMVVMNVVMVVTWLEVVMMEVPLLEIVEVVLQVWVVSYLAYWLCCLVGDFGSVKALFSENHPFSLKSNFGHLF